MVHNEERFSESFGFTEQEVDELYERYLTQTYQRKPAGLV